MQHAYKPRGKRYLSRRQDPIAAMSAYRYQAMMRALVDQTRNQRESANTTGGNDQSNAGTGLV
jgi:predicted secreted protein